MRHSVRAGGLLVPLRWRLRRKARLHDGCSRRRGYWAIEMKRFGLRLWRATQLWIEVDGTFIAAAVSFYAALAIFPLIVLLMSIFGWQLSKSTYLQDWETRLLDFVANESSQQLADQLAIQLGQIQSAAIVSGPLSLITLLVLAGALFVNLERAFHRIWKTRPEPAGIFVNLARIISHRLRAFIMLVGIILVVLLNFAANITIEMIAQFAGNWIISERVWRLAHVGASVAINAFMFTAVYQTVPNEKVLWRHAIQGGVLTAASWEAGRFVLASLIVSERYNAFGVVGAFLALLLWLFYGSIVILFGATFVRVTGQLAPAK